MKEKWAAKLALYFPVLYLYLTNLETRLGTSYLPLPALLRSPRKGAH